MALGLGTTLNLTAKSGQTDIAMGAGIAIGDGGIDQQQSTSVIHDAIFMYGAVTGLDVGLDTDPVILTAEEDLETVLDDLVIDTETNGYLVAGDTFVVEGVTYTIDAVLFDPDVTFNTITGNITLPVTMLQASDTAGNSVTLFLPIDAANDIPDIASIEVNGLFNLSEQGPVPMPDYFFDDNQDVTLFSPSDDGPDDGEESGTLFDAIMINGWNAGQTEWIAGQDITHVLDNIELPPPPVGILPAIIGPDLPSAEPTILVIEGTAYTVAELAYTSDYTIITDTGDMPTSSNLIAIDAVSDTGETISFLVVVSGAYDYENIQSIQINQPFIPTPITSGNSLETNNIVTLDPNMGEGVVNGESLGEYMSYESTIVPAAYNDGLTNYNPETGNYEYTSLTNGGGDEITHQADIIAGNAGDDTILSGGGDDFVLGGAGDDILIGGAGEDILIGGAGADILIGGTGDDEIIFGVGDRASGGIGSDYFSSNVDGIEAGVTGISGGEDVDGTDFDVLDLADIESYATNISVVYAGEDGEVSEQGYVFYTDEDGEERVIKFDGIEQVISQDPGLSVPDDAPIAAKNIPLIAENSAKLGPAAFFEDLMIGDPLDEKLPQQKDEDEDEDTTEMYNFLF